MQKEKVHNNLKELETRVDLRMNHMRKIFDLDDRQMAKIAATFRHSQY